VALKVADMSASKIKKMVVNLDGHLQEVTSDGEVFEQF
jgi:hypothetical protein